ncbi:GntR family transcriptional regulator [Tautonia plasticadhaerens]|uniref:HTH-type transcriptional repressor YtrA n=1 Tax=Tautonia plasticadhaerens TaxID=2527974 RepID=A0A518GVY8_9BACT|nr:GntR family transcriptional regulator [Tautonia plasticadhaerens]QDV32763.1 HTH-type transcriptional repressor YtrA [Tautonia plasticadhaerens]
MLLLGLSPGDDRAIYAQIADRVRFAVAAGAPKPGELVPSVRELARQLVVNPNTVARAYRELQAEGVLEAVRGTGLAVTALAPDRCRSSRRDHVRSRLRAAIAEARASGLDPSEIELILREEWDATNGEPTGSAASREGRR